MYIQKRGVRIHTMPTKYWHSFKKIKKESKNDKKNNNNTNK